MLKKVSFEYFKRRVVGITPVDPKTNVLPLF